MEIRFIRFRNSIKSVSTTSLYAQIGEFAYGYKPLSLLTDWCRSNGSR